MTGILTGLNYMVVGMGAVFLFLLVLVASMGIMRTLLGSGEDAETETNLQRSAAAAGAAFRIRSARGAHEKN